MLADWLIENGHPDPAADLRGAYSTALGCKRLVRRRGGLVAVVAACVAKPDLPRTIAPKVADIGVIETMTLEGLQMVGAICTGPRWAMLGVKGLVSVTASPVAAWAV